MQLRDILKIKHWNPLIYLFSTRDNAGEYLGVINGQLAHDGVAFSNVKTKKFTIGAPGVAGCDKNFASAANTTEQVIDLGASVIPAFARVLDVVTRTVTAFTPDPTTLVMETGVSSSGNELVASATIKAANAITQMATGSCPALARTSSAQHVYCAATPGANWSTITAGKLEVEITYIELI